MASLGVSFEPLKRTPSLEAGDNPVMRLRWYHPHLTRHAADCMLIDNAPEGSYLLRDSSEGQGYVLSVKLSSSVQHVKILHTTVGGYKFGNSTFRTTEQLRKHFELEKPVIGGDSGITVVLKFPYFRNVTESHLYTDVVHHAVTNMLESSGSVSGDSIQDGIFEEITAEEVQRTVAVSSKEGYMTKLGRVRKSWRVRWFVLRNNYLTYFKTKQSRTPIRTLDLLQARCVEYDDSKSKNFCFRIEFLHRTFYIYANSTEDCTQWVDLLRSRVPSTVPSSR